MLIATRGCRRLWLERLESRRLLSTATWISAAGGSWSTAANWSTGAVPQAGDDVVINQPGNIQITLASNTSVKSLTITGDTLVVSTGVTLTTTGAVANNGAINVSAGGQLAIGGAYTESSGATLSMPGGGPTADPAANQYANTDFESPVITTSGVTAPTSWSQWGSAYLSKQYAYSGAQSIQITGANSGVDQRFSVTPGVSYTLSTYGMTPAADPLTGSQAGSLQLIFYTAAGVQLSDYAPPNQLVALSASSATGGPLAGSVGSQGWNHFTATAVAPATASYVNALLSVYNGTGVGGGSVYWDAPKFGPTVPGYSKVSAASIYSSGAITVGPTNTLTSTSTFTQTSTGTLDIQLGGTYDTGNVGLVSSDGAATLAGTLKSEFVYGYSPSTTDTFAVMTFPSETGVFSTYSLAGNSSVQFSAAVTFTNVTLAATPTAALTTSVNAAASLHPVSPNVSGINLSFWDGDGTTTQTQQLIEQAGLNLLRFPGGSSSDDFHFNVANNANYSGAETVAQFAQVISAVSGTGVVTLDYGSGSPQEAAAEMAYLLGSPSDTTTIGTGIEWNDTAGAWQNVNWGTVGYWAGLRAASPLGTNDGLNFLRIAHSAPFANIKYWEVGNEQYGDWEIDNHGTAGPGGISTGAQHDPATYIAFAKTFATFAAEITTAAGISPVSIGIDSGDPTAAGFNGWIKNVLTDGAAAGFVPGFISDHNYMSGVGLQLDSTLLNHTDAEPGNVLDWGTRYTDYEALLQQAYSAPQAAGVQILGTEYNSSSAWSSDATKQSTSLVDGLFIANSIGSLMAAGYEGACVWDLRDGWSTADNNNEVLYGWRNGATLGMLGDPGYNTPPANAAYVAFPGYYALQLTSELMQSGGEIVSASSNYNEFNSYAVLEPNGHLELLVVNTNPAASLNEQFNLSGFQPSGAAQFWQYGEVQDTAQSKSSTGASALANFNTTLSLAGSSFSYSFPAYSMTVIDLTPNIVSGSVFNDANNSGSKDAGETSLAAVKVTLTPTGSTSGSAVSTTSAADGTYSFTNVPLGTYTLSETPPSGYALTAPVGGAAAITVSAGVTSAGPVFGDVLISSVTLNFAMLVEVSQNYNKAATFAGGDLNGDGIVNFTDLVLLSQNYGKPLPAGDYTFTTAASAALTPLAASPASSAQPASTRAALPALFPLTPSAFTSKATTTPTTLGSITGTIFNDANGDGLRQNNETGLSGRTVYLELAGKGTVGQMHTTTSTTGAFSFSNLAAGSYVLIAATSTGWRSTTAAASEYPITLAKGAKIGALAFGQTQLVLIAGSVYLDANQNGVRDGNETGLAGWTLTLQSTTKASRKWITTTNSAGAFSIAWPADSYTLKLTVPTGYAPTTPATDSYTIKVAAGQSLAGLNFGQHPVLAAPVTITAIRAVDPLNAAEDIVTFYALNNDAGAWAGTSKLLAEDATLSSSSGLTIRADDADGSGQIDDADFAGLSAAPTASFIRIGGPTFFVASTTPAANSGLFKDDQSIASFEVAGTILGGVVANAGQGTRIAEALVPHLAPVTLAGSLAAEAGPIVTFSDTAAG